MATLLSKFATRQAGTTVGDCAGDLIVNRFYIDLAVGDLLAGNLIDLGVLPAGHAISSAHLVPDDLDTGAAITLDVGIMSGTTGDNVSVRTVGQELFTGATGAQTGAPATSAQKSMYTLPAVGYDRSIGVKIATAPAGAVAGRIRLSVVMFPTDSNFQY